MMSSTFSTPPIAFVWSCMALAAACCAASVSRLMFITARERVSSRRRPLSQGAETGGTCGG